LLQDVRTGVTVTGAWSTIPQIICLVVVGRLAAALTPQNRPFAS
jgi:hypothetical protein